MTFDAAAFVAEFVATNSLVEIADYLDENPEEQVYYADRHALGTADWFAPEVRGPACEAALALAYAWRCDRDSLRARGYLVSVPVTFIDDEWLDGCENPPPPHVWICVARTSEAYADLPAVLGEPRERSGRPEIDALLRDGIALLRAEPDELADEDERGQWVLRFTASARE